MVRVQGYAILCFVLLILRIILIQYHPLYIWIVILNMIIYKVRSNLYAVFHTSKGLLFNCSGAFQTGLIQGADEMEVLEDAFEP